MYVMYGEMAVPVEPGAVFVITGEKQWIAYLCTDHGIYKGEWDVVDGGTLETMLEEVNQWAKLPRSAMPEPVSRMMN